MTEKEYEALDYDVELCTEQEMSLFDTEQDMLFAFEWVRFTRENNRIEYEAALEVFLGDIR